MSEFSIFFQEIISFVSFNNIMLMALAMILGIIAGALPGLSATVGIALLTGITYTFSADVAIIMMIGLYIGAIYAGSLTAILINIPGTGSAAATCLDGYALARQGHAQDAIMTARIASFIGAMFGLIAFILLTPLVVRFALEFTSPEFFWLSIFGILICGSLTNEDLPVKGWIAGMAGMLLSYVGLEDIQAYERFTLGVPQLISGIPYIPLMIGFFGIPQIIKLIQMDQRVVKMKSSGSGFKMWKLIKKNFLGIINWALIGLGIGAIPGAGENIASWTAYGIAKRSSKNPEEFGKGKIEGVLAPEVANNSAIAGAMIPLLALGIPGSPPTAILMGALILHGIRPGPMLATEHPEFMYQMGSWLFWGAIMLLIIGILTARPMSYIMKVNPKVLASLIAVLCIVGTFSVSNEVFDLQLVFIFGIVGYIFDKHGYAPGPLVLGFILGPLTDANLRRTLAISDGQVSSLVDRPISLVLFLAVVFTVINTLYPIRKIFAKLSSKKGETNQ
jgi:putative tricarboxylic transport membrane protein